MAMDCKCDGLKGIQAGLKPKCLCDSVAKQLHFNCKIDGPHGKFAEKLSIAPHACISHKPTFISGAGMVYHSHASLCVS